MLINLLFSASGQAHSALVPMDGDGAMNSLTHTLTSTHGKLGDAVRREHKGRFPDGINGSDGPGRLKFSVVGRNAVVPPATPGIAASFSWLPTGQQWFQAIEAALDQAQSSVDVEFYIWSAGRLATRLESGLVAAAARGCCVRVLLDAYGSASAGPTVERLRHAGVAVAWFNPRRISRLTFRNHRKLVVIDGRQAFLGGCNVADEYDGNGVDAGWRDLGLSVVEPACARALAASFDRMWDLAPFDHLPTPDTMPQSARGSGWELFSAGAGRGGRRYRRRLHGDLERACRIDVLAAYFVPTSRLRRLLCLVARRGDVRIVVPASGDVALAHHASAHVLDELSSSKLQIFEYIPSMLHAKLVVVDDVVYIGSANFDPRSLRINFDVMLRIEDAGAAMQARAIVDEIQRHARPYRASRRGILARTYRRLAYAAMAWLDPLIARRKLRLLA